jgi:hypothetical protein
MAIAVQGGPPGGHAVDDGSSVVEGEVYALGGGYDEGGEGVDHGGVGVEDVVAVDVEEGLDGGGGGWRRTVA